ncbi:scavenger receptor cysteine-rich type 1 protein M160 [Anarrhichthys ocellatus]|uniref:scavenger receptor cysteine-rich type 1 protein M160 n=1 Tax=Anarrhichthys ocellatus TaxID=433405 RepID=UPI0012ED546D|nr:scavenger receptor cysteine-rich type 1 protein M160-like [Anarrhichthys ocellatus]
MMWFLLLLLCTAHNQPLIVQGEESTILLHGRNPCEGYIGIYHNSTLGYVGGTNWNDNNDKVVCKSINCGVPKERSSMPTPGPIEKVWIDEVNCKGDESNLWECSFPGWAVIPPPMGSLQKITCSHKISISLDGFRCAGAVQYSKDGGDTYSGYFCDTNWDKTADLLCKTLNCGTSKKIVQQPWMGWKGFKEKSERMKINCLGNATHLWQCAQPLEKTPCTNPASVICTDHERVQLKPDASNVCSGKLLKEEKDVWNPVQNNKTDPNDWCKQMHCGSSVSHSQDDNGSHLTCSDDIKVVLMVNNKHTRCYGSVYVEVNGTSQPVCASNWNDEAAKVVCSELKCGRVFRTSKKSNTRGIMDHVSCSGNEASLWHCRAKRDNNNPLSCTSTAYVVCSDSIGVRLRDGPGRCAGRLEIQHEDTWQRVFKGLSNSDSGFVCRQLDCGKKGKSDDEKFSQGSGRFLAYAVQCKNKAKDISDCLREINKLMGKGKAMEITCEEHKMVFLKESCSGMVGIEQGDKIYWLSGSNTTWNQESANTVCQQMHCGNASVVTSISSDNLAISIWKESYSCSSNNESLFNCKKIETLPSDHADTIATVTCSGKITVALDKECWGNVRVCLNNTCGGVCADTWTVEKSEMLCKNLYCGKALIATAQPKQSQVIFKSVHSTNVTTNLTQCNFVRNDDNVKTCVPAYVVCSGSVKPRFNDPRDKCSGNVEVHYEDKWLPVCAGALKDNNINTICEELKCGKAGKPIAYFGPEAARPYSITEIQCYANKLFGACTIKPEKTSCDRGALQCSEWRKMALATEKACSGAAMVHSEGKKSAIVFEGWTETMGEKLCKDLECGPLKNNTKINFWSFLNTSFSCADVEDPNKTIWDCEKKVSPFGESQSKPQLLIECQGEPEVTLSKTWYSNVMINGTEVCDSNWKENDSHMVCRQNNRSKAITNTSHNENPIQGKDYYHVSCEDNHYALGQCKRALGQCTGKLVSVYCVGNAQFNTTEKCGGQIQVKYREKWEKVCPLTSFSKTHSKMLCEQLSCHGYKQMQSKYNDMVDLETSLSCTADNQDIKHCLSQQSCKGERPAEIYCDEYVAQPTKQPDPLTTPIWPTMLVVGFALVLVILIVVFIQIYKKSSNDLPGMLSRKEVEIESGSYDDVMSKSNEMEELNHGRLRSESEVVMETDAPSTSSFPYDDIDNPAAAQPLISQAATAGASGGDCIQNGAIYEVDDQQENHEDIEASPEITRTEAQVHDSTQTTPESDAAAPLGSVQGD